LLGEGAEGAFCGRNPGRLARAPAALANENPEGGGFSLRRAGLNAAGGEAVAAAGAARFGGVGLLINN
ncbi:short chain dehydrogenase, partial [Klebsiella pneumoniae]|nr:short chain dehydrogenase [Klebsiella pneumoniae]